MRCFPPCRCRPEVRSQPSRWAVSARRMPRYLPRRFWRWATRHCARSFRSSRLNLPEKSRNRTVRAENDIGAIEQALEALGTGDCVVYPTETFYALGADATSASALERLVALKRREADKPVALIVADLAMAR